MEAIRVGFGRQIRAVNVDRRSAQRREAAAKRQQMGLHPTGRRGPYCVALGVELRGKRSALTESRAWKDGERKENHI
ncbi:hypothetical protein EYF80_065652 [Liparis tanakae]|uniref:Uncharacterized protein n=1 Tax=Liparis tanakae TaxID=230148 RepID=A0A4Z2E621_9TELE|nr:hypothetical protein EYF80_065652 [Liparis tanakae]